MYLGGGGRFDDEDDEERSSQKSAPSPGVSEFKDDGVDDGFADLGRRNVAAIPRKPSGGPADFNGGRHGGAASTAAKPSAVAKAPGKSSVPSRKVRYRSYTA
jgi:hypothetical protein